MVHDLVELRAEQLVDLRDPGVDQRPPRRWRPSAALGQDLVDELADRVARIGCAAISSRAILPSAGFGRAGSRARRSRRRLGRGLSLRHHGLLSSCVRRPRGAAGQVISSSVARPGIGASPAVPALEPQLFAQLSLSLGALDHLASIASSSSLPSSFVSRSRSRWRAS